MNAPLPFVGATTSQTEDRINLALFSLMGIPGARIWLLRQLGLPIDCILYPPQQTMGARPDFVVVDPYDTVIAWIEVEIGAEDTSQLLSYRQIFQAPIKSIVGSSNDGGDLSLEVIVYAVKSELSALFDRQQSAHVAVFCALIRSLLGACPAIDTDGVCGRPLVGTSDYCKKHDMRYRRHGDPTKTLRPWGRKRASASR